MTRKVIGFVGAIALSFSALVSAPAYAVVGPWTTVDWIYTRTENARPFIRFAANGMPGCYQEAGAYLGNSDPERSKQTYATILAALTAGREVRVSYNITGVSSGWSMCEIQAIYIR